MFLSFHEAPKPGIHKENQNKISEDITRQKSEVHP